MQAFSAYEPIFEEVDFIADKLNLKKLTELLRKRPKIFYLNPSFQNPTGQSLTLEQRQFVADLTKQFPQTLFLEDAAYTDLFFNKAHPDLVSLSLNIIHLGTFSKTLAPGLRLGYIVGPKKLIRTLTLIKQSIDLHTNSLSQMIVNEILKEEGWFSGHLIKIRKFYARQSKIMGKILAQTMPKTVTWNEPQGGLYYWLKTKINTQKLYKKAVQQNIAFVPGHVFFANRPEYNYLRLSFATVDEEKMKRGLKILGKLLN